ncbi:DUF3616 domain-containing protein [Chitinimonas lacunae]|uniref:DUF3616 domain-containing protein n=1 Tax=Chitinimonas lacunae TaxID=1963018 RepID=A0ABV8MMX0_9NEIS
MPRELLQHAIRLEFESDTLVHANLSGAAWVRNDLWVAGDEACGLDRLRRLDPVGDEKLRFGDPVNFPLADYLDLPDAHDIEADIEGIDVHGGYLWLVGSHGLKRRNPKPERDQATNLKRLATVSHDGNRYLLARIPLVEKDGVTSLARRTDDGRIAARLRGDDRHNDLTRALYKDPHLGAFLDIPGKDNGFDIEGLAVDEQRVLLGLRGPVLRGWACLLELNPIEKKGSLRLDDVAASERPYRKHFLRVGGLGVRDLHWYNGDLYMLAGPTMVLDGAVRVYRWHDAAALLDSADARADALLWDEPPELVLELPHGIGTDRAEALTQVPSGVFTDKPHWLVLYDAPGADRQPTPYTVLGDLLRR